MRAVKPLGRTRIPMSGLLSFVSSSPCLENAPLKCCSFLPGAGKLLSMSTWMLGANLSDY